MAPGSTIHFPDRPTDRLTDGRDEKPVPIPAYALLDIATWLKIIKLIVIFALNFDAPCALRAQQVQELVEGHVPRPFCAPWWHMIKTMSHMSTPLLPEVVPEIDAYPVSFYSGRGELGSVMVWSLKNEANLLLSLGSKS